MNAPLRMLDLARQFWEIAGATELFPRTLRLTAVRSLPLTVLEKPDLSVALIRSWVQKNSVPCPCNEADRALHGCLLAYRGHGFVFINLSDSENEQRFTLAHELAHFLRDYWQPRRLAVNHFGDSVIEVLDGMRPPSAEERLHALLRNVPIGFHTHFMDRDHDQNLSNVNVAQAEVDADRLAYELLAPAEVVLQRLEKCNVHQNLSRQSNELLGKEFGFPLRQANLYAQILLPAASEDLLLARLRKKS